MLFDLLLQNTQTYTKKHKKYSIKRCWQSEINSRTGQGAPAPSQQQHHKKAGGVGICTGAGAGSVLLKGPSIFVAWALQSAAHPQSLRGWPRKEDYSPLPGGGLLHFFGGCLPGEVFSKKKKPRGAP